jgi:hypothetical protein
MTDTSDTTREVQLVFAPRSGGGLEKTKFGVKEFSAKVDEIKNWFKDYKISQVLSFGFKER